MKQYLSLIKNKLIAWCKHWPKLNTVQYLYVLSGLVFFTIMLLTVWFGYQYLRSRPFGEVVIYPTKEAGVLEEWEKEKICPYRRELDGVCVKSADRVSSPLIAVMIDNHLDSRPLAGLAKASVVYEAPVEGNSTRFMALYPLAAEVDKVGPVRSARPYYLDWLQEYDPVMYLHVGGSPESLREIERRNVFSLNEFYRGWYYWRDRRRVAPYNTYTSSELWQKAWGGESDRRGVDEGVDGSAGWLFADREICAGEVCVSQFTVSFAPPTYQAGWKFNANTAQYERYQMSAPQADEDGMKVVADTVIIQYAQARVIDAIGRQRITTIGKGEGIVFRDGYMFPAIWKKNDSRHRTVWFDVDNHPLPFKAGKIWIEIVPPDVVVEWSK